MLIHKLKVALNHSNDSAYELVAKPSRVFVEEEREKRIISQRHERQKGRRGKKETPAWPINPRLCDASILHLRC